MDLWNRIKGWFGMILGKKAEEDFSDESITKDELLQFIGYCERIYAGVPDWVKDLKDVTTINFAKSVCSEVARLVTMNIDIKVEGSARADWLNEQMERLKYMWRIWTEFGCKSGTLIMKPNGSSIDILTPEYFMITDTVDDVITGIIFVDTRKDGKDWYTRYEYHSFKDGVYTIKNTCYVGSKRFNTDKPVMLENSPWSDLSDEVTAENVERMLFGVFRMPGANNIDEESVLGLPIFADAVEELKDLDVAYSRNAKEIYDSKRTVLLDSDRLLPTGGRIGANQKGLLVEQAGLPDFVKLLDGDGVTELYHEINPTLNTAVRKDGINVLLSQIGYKCGFSNGYFVFDQKTGMVTATQVESDDRRTLQLVNDVRAQLQSCIDGLIYALDKFADAYQLAPRGTYEVTYDFADLTLNEEEDRARWLSYAQQGFIPFWYFLTKYEGMTEEEAKALIETRESSVMYDVES